ncbi:MAG: ParB/RepB/Spo0J family partition protein [Actinomycetaceae bacterium]|nr:ParB/RepB/Spo0J family partition protein [Actinomycetaceae bacterium]MDU0969958.1 ParB/RepB/Spo0J family partition protein [Actinomycetaceae bacterium]
MARKKGGLGRGLAALIPEDQQDRDARPTNPLDVFFGESEQSQAEELRGGSARDLLMPAGKTRASKSGAKSGGRGQSASARGAAKGVGGAQATSGGKDASAAKRGSQKRSQDALAAASKGQQGGAGRTPADALDALRGGASGAPRSREESVPATAIDDLVPVTGVTFGEIPVDQVQPNRWQPREVFDEEMLAELAQSIREVGVLQPIVVRPVSDDVSRETIPSAEGEGSVSRETIADGESQDSEGTPATRYELIMGERRWRAAQKAGLPTIPAIIRRTEDSEMLRDALLENLHRSQLNPLEEAAAYQQLMDEFSCTQAQLSQRIARSRSQIANTVRLLKLPASVQRRVAAEVISAGHARALLALTDVEDMEYLANRIVAEGLSVRTTEEIVALGDVRGSAKPAKSGQRRTPAVPDPRYTHITDRLTDYLDTKIKVQPGKKRGRIVIEFSDDEDLARIERAITQSPS